MSHPEEETPAGIGEQATIESGIADLSIRFINVPPDQVDPTITDGLRLTCEWFDLDLGAVWQRESDDPRPRKRTHFYSRVGPPPTEDVDPVTEYPWSLPKILAGQPVGFTSVDEIPPGAETR